ncbi:MAG: Fibronectin type domain protein [Bacteroidota bacterium]|nr:Fibronectin type domain protein [Bacteroidota bacterium]
MRIIYLLIVSLLLAISNNSWSQSITQLPGEGALNYSKVFQGSGKDVTTDASCFLIKGKGMLSIGFEVQKNGTATWPTNTLWFKVRGQWVHIMDLFMGTDRGAGSASFDANSFIDPGTNKYYTENTDRICTVNGFASNDNTAAFHSYIKNYGNLKIYDGNYAGTSGLTFRQVAADLSTFNLQTAAWAPPYVYPVYNPDISSGVQALTGSYDRTHANQRWANLPGVATCESTPGRIVVVINIVNLPPEMLDDPAGFRVHMFQDANTGHDRTFEWVFNSSENFMNNAPSSLNASKDLCGKVQLTWANAYNPVPSDGQVDIKTVIFRNGTYLGMVDDTQTTFDDLTAAQDVEYDYTLLHVAFSESGKTYFRSPSTAPVKGSVKPSPDEPISPTASSDKCNNKIDLGWNFNGVNPARFRVDYSMSSTGTFTTLTNTLAGGSRSYAHTGVTRGQNYYYRIYAINSCSVLSTTYAVCNGISPSDPAMATGITAVTNTVTNTVDLSWTDNANNETKYQIVRTDDVGNTVLTDVNLNSTSYIDNSAASCRLYTYKVRAFNDCVLSGITSTTSATATLPPPNLGSTFTSTKKLTASKGYFSNRVELSWSNNNGLNIDVFKIYRKQLGTTADSVQIAAAGPGTALFIDNTADARVFYRYTIVGVKNCNGSDLLSNISSDIGFRNPTGLVSGHIEYNGGIAVGGAKVFIQQSGATVGGNSLDFNNAGVLTVTDKVELEPGAQMRMEFWLKPTAFSGATNLIVNKTNAFDFGYVSSNWRARIFTGGTAKTINLPGTTFTTAQWNHVSIVYNGTVLKLFANGTLAGTVAATGNIDDNANSLVFGDATSDFFIDEFRLIGQSRSDSVISVESNRILNGDESDFKCNLHFNEAVGTFAYDVSKVGNFFNGNHGVFSGSVNWSTDKPTSSQLGYFGVTDNLGNYIATGIQYMGSGENFNLVPSYATHSFSPNSRSVYIGDGSFVYNNQDFIDNSSFPVTGTLFYKGTTCAVSDAVLKLDGNAIISGGAQVKTDANGTFSISVPIGNHYISVEKTGHDMVLGGRYPATGTHNFQAPVSGIIFQDSTLRKVVGRVVGGDVQGDKIANLGKSINNIGKAYIELASPLTGAPCFTTSVITNTATGEYEFNIPPVQYKITQAYVMSNSVSINMNVPNSLKFASNTFDLTNTNFLTTEKDSIFVTLGNGTNQRDSLIQVDSVKFHKRIDFIHYSSPKLGLADTLGNRFIGEKFITLPTTPTSTVSAVPSTTTNWGPLGFPVFKQNNYYKAKITAVQTYTNADTPSMVDTVKLNGLVTVANNLIDGVDPNPNVSLNNGVAYYSFICGSPNTATYTPNFMSYTKAMQINITPEGQPTYSLSPNATTTVSPGYNMYRAYVLGSLLDGTGFATVGPERIDMILRDPPGSGSSSTWSSGTSTTKVENIYNGGGVTQGISAETSVGTKQTVGLGVGIEIDISADVELGTETTISGGKTNQYTETVTTMNEVSTRDDADYVGASADVFVGRSRNWYMGPTINLELRPASTCTLVECVGPNISGFRLAKISGLSLAPGEVKTRFSYTQNEIEENVIPSLEALRLSFFTRAGSRYTSAVSASDPKFGANNDDPLWATPSSTTPAIFEKTLDRTGPSYTFNYATGTNTVITYINNSTFPPSVSTATLPVEVEDSVRIINNQIRLWKEALRDNEKEKHQCVNNMAGTLVDNFSLGSAILNNSYSVTFENSEEKSFEFSLDASATYTVKAKIGNTGGEFEGGTTLNYSRSVNTSTNTTTENTFQYTLTDGDPGDLMSIDVYRMPMGNVFITRGGQTMCPYEDALVLHYYNPSAPTAWISSHTYNEAGFQTIAPATIKREVPEIVVDGSTSSTKYNIPSNQAASFQLQLSNQSLLTVNNSVDLQVRVESTSNPNGAILKIDGQNANDVFNIPSGGSVNKVLTVERGPVEIEYDSLMVIFSSACSSDIADTAYVSVHFIPTCTDLAITVPTNNFIINNSNNSLANVIIGDYNYNYGAAVNTSTLTSSAHPYYGFEKIGFEIKPSSSSTWLQIQEFYKYPSAVGSNSLFPIPNNQVYTQYNWSVTPNSYADGNYEIRGVSSCYNKDGSYATVYSPVLQGVMDRVNPHPFGTPSPGDGILDPNDDISIQFNEPIDISSLNYAPSSNPNSTFDIRGVLNGTTLRHSESLNFDGTADYAEVTGGASLQKRSFTFEFWAKFNPTGAEQTVISQGTDAVQKMSIGFDNSNRLKFSLGSQIALSTNPITLPTDWHHYAVVYDHPNSDVSLFVDGSLAGTNNSFLVEYTGSGKLAFGKALPANNNFLNGNAHEIRLWSKTRTISEITVTMNKSLSRNQSGLVYNWKMDEADGSVANDDIRSRNATIYGATWEVNPNGNAVQLSSSGNDNIKVSSGNIAINKEMDFTLEFWFNSTQSGISTLFSNGEGIATSADSLDAWTIQKDGTGAIHVYHKGLDFVASTTNYFDGTWHHFALVMQRTGNLSAYLDGNLQNSTQGINFNNLAGSYMYLGAKAVIAGSTTTLSNYYDGKIDEFRLWSTARKSEQVKRDKQNRMLGDEHGLLAYLPFENYTVVMGTPSLTPTFNNQSLETLTVTPQGATALIGQTPTIKLPRPIQSVNYTWSLNNDKIILTTNTSPDQLENVTLDITVKNALDMHGNKMQSPKTWIAYMNKNQVKWQDDQFDFEKTVDSVITFVAPIVNSGGAQKAFTIDGLPNWMTANITSGVIAPNSVQNVTFTIPAGGSIGNFDAEVSVTTDFNFAEILRVNLKVKGISPNWVVDPADFSYSMNVFGQLRIDNVIATNPESKIAAFSNGVICGVANLQYLSAYDRYEVFLNVYNNQITGDSIRFNIYDAESGLTFVNVTPSLMFVENDVVGTVTSPITFVANTEISRDIPLNAGWTWVSFPLKSNKLLSSNSLMTSIAPSNGDISTGISDYDQYDTSLGWIGNISQNGGYFNNQSYKIKKAVADTLVHVGMRLNPDSIQAQINVVPGWNWIGYVSNKNASVSEALGNYNAQTGDLIKSQYEFAYYDNLIGWTGSLTQMKPTLGYMLKSTGTSAFSYPLSTFIGKMASQTDYTVNEASQNIFPFTPELYSNTMSAIITGNICNDALDNGNVAIGAFDNTNTMRGFAYPTLVDNNYKFFLTLYSNSDGETLNVKYFNTTDGLVIATNTVVSFATDAVVGTPSVPFVANVDDSLACHVVEITTGVNESFSESTVGIYPNPFEDDLTLTFNKSVSAKIELLDVLGKVVYSSAIKDKKEFTLNIDRSKTNIAIGMYYIRLSGDVNEQIKVVKTK